MTFEQFLATKTSCDDIGEAISADMGVTDPVTGNLYLGCLYIEARQDWWPEDARKAGAWYLMLENTQFISDDLEMLERKLFDYAVANGYDLNS